MRKPWLLKLLITLMSVSLMLPCADAQTSHASKRYRNGIPDDSTPFAGAFSLQQIVADMDRKATAGVIVRSVQSGKTLYEKDSDQLFSPASNMKVITAFAALKFLGPDFTYHTRLMTDALTTLPKDGVLQGNLYLKYDGDPTLRLNDLDDLFRVLKESGIRAIQGNLYVDTSRYDKQGISPGTEATDRAYCYGAPVTASILNRNCVTMTLYPGRIGAPARLSFPYDVNLPVINSVVTSASRSCRLSLKQPANGRYLLDGCVSTRKQPVALTIPIPADCGYGDIAAAKFLSRNGITVIGSDLPTHASEQALRLIKDHPSKTLDGLVVEMMKKSDNLIANTLFKTVGARYNQQTATWQNSGNAVKAILQKNNIDTTGMQIIDGSGLSRDDRVTPAQFSQVLMAAYKDPNVAPTYLKALPVGGLNGTLKYRLGSKDIIGKVKAKTGSMHGVSSLSGYVETRSGEVLAFSIIVNDFVGGLYPYRMMEDKLCRVLRAKY